KKLLPDQIVQRVFRPELLTDVFGGRALFDPDLVKFHRRMAHQRILSLMIRRTEMRPVGSRRAISALLAPARCSSESQSCAMAPSRAGPAHRHHLKHNAAKRQRYALNHKTTRERIRLQFFLAQLRQRVDALSSIDRFDRHQDAHLGRDLDHACSHNARLSPARSGAVVPFHWIRILPCGPSNSMRHSDGPPVWGATNSTNAGAAVFAIGLADCTIRLSLPYSKRNTFAG